jgi:hypothetical protein
MILYTVIRIFNPCNIVDDVFHIIGVFESELLAVKAIEEAEHMPETVIFLMNNELNTRYSLHNHGEVFN